MRELEINDVASARKDSRSDAFAPSPMKPNPPASDTATASSGPDITRIGALMISGDDVHGKAIFKLRKCRATDAMMIGKCQIPPYSISSISFINSILSKLIDSHGNVKYWLDKSELCKSIARVDGRNSEKVGVKVDRRRRISRETTIGFCSHQR